LKGLVKFLDFFKQTSPQLVNNIVTLFIGVSIPAYLYRAKYFQDINTTQVLVTSECEFYYVDFGVAQITVRGAGVGGMAGGGTDDILVRSAHDSSTVFEDAHRRVLLDVYKCMRQIAFCLLICYAVFEEEYTRDAIRKLCCRDLSPDVMKKRIETHIEELKHRGSYLRVLFYFHVMPRFHTSDVCVSVSCLYASLPRYSCSTLYLFFPVAHPTAETTQVHYAKDT
jgi:hypothetical protein